MESISTTERAPQVDWEQNDLFKGLSPEQLVVLADYVKSQEFEAGEIVFKEGDKGKRIYLIVSGEVSIFREEQRFRLNTLSPGDSFGAMALLNNIPRSASVMTIKPSQLCYITIGSLKSLAVDGHESIYLQITKNHLYSLYEVVDKSDRRIIESNKRELKATKAKIAFASFFTTVVFLISLYVFMLRSSIVWIENLRNSTYVTSGMLLFTLGILLYMLKLNRYPIRYYGINTRNWRRAVPRAIGWSLVFMLGATLIKAICIATLPAFEGVSILGMPGFQEGISQNMVYILLYIAFAPVQEFFARGVIQGTLQKFLTGRFVNARSIAISTLLFSTTHVHLDMAFAFLVIVPSIFWGMMYAKQGSLLGVSISHIMIGVYLTFVMGFM